MARGRARSKRKQVVPLPTATLVDYTLRWLRLDDTVRGMRAMRAFGLAAGPRILERARAERLRGRTLYVRVASAGWSQELHVLRSTILERMRALPGGEEVEELRFSVGNVNELPDWAAPELPPAPPQRKRPVTQADAIYEALSAIEDPELRDQLTSLLGRATAK
jgi:hypothetical protein